MQRTSFLVTFTLQDEPGYHTVTVYCDSFAQVEQDVLKDHPTAYILTIQRSWP